MGDQGFIDFVAHLLEINPKKRPSASEALKHPWLSYPYEPISSWAIWRFFCRRWYAAGALVFVFGCLLNRGRSHFYFWLKLVVCFRGSSKRNWPLHLCTMHWRLCLVLLVIPIFPSPCQFVIPTNHNQECNFARSLYSWGCFVWSGGRNLKNRVVHDVWSFF